MGRFSRLTLALLALLVASPAAAQTIASDRILGRDTAGVGQIEQLTVNGALSFTGTGGITATGSNILGQLTAGTALDFSGSTINWDSTEVGNTTWGSGSQITWTFDASGGDDPSLEVGEGYAQFGGGLNFAFGGVAADDGATGPGFYLLHSSANPADNDLVGYANFYGFNDAVVPDLIDYVTFSFTALDVSDNTEDGRFVVSTFVNGVRVEGLILDPNGLAVVDEAYNGTDWNGDLTVPTKNAVRDKIEALIVGGATLSDGDYGDIEVTDTGATFTVESIQTLTINAADAGTNAFFGWDDTAGAYENLTNAEAEAIMEPLIDTLANLASVNGESVTFTADPGADAFFGFDDSADTYEALTASEALEIIKTVDGSGSGLDADTLDGVSSAGFLQDFNFTDDAATAGLAITEAETMTFAGDSAGIDTAGSGNTLTISFDVTEAEANIESAIDTLANLTSVQGLTVTLADAGADAVWGWDDSASAYENLTAAEVLAVIEASTPLLTEAEAAAAYQPLDSDLTSWSGVTRAAGYDTFAATPSSANLASLVTDDAFSLADAELGALSGLTSAANRVPYFTGSGTAALFAFAPTDDNLDVLAGWDDSDGQYESLALAEIATEASPAAGDFVIIYGAEGDVRKVDWDDLPSGGASSFLDLTDTPSAYTGAAGDCVLVNGTEDGLEFGSCGAGSLPADPGADSFLIWDEDDNQSEWLSNADTETLIESLVDTLANLTSVQGLTVTLADAGADAVFGWDDSQSAYENLTAAEVYAIISSNIDAVFLTEAEASAAYQPLDADLTTLSTAFTTASASGAATLKFAEDTDNGSNTATLAGPASTADVTLTLQATTGTIYSTGGTDVSLADGGTGASLADPGADRILWWDESDNALELTSLIDLATEAAPASGDFLLMVDASGVLTKVDWSNVGGGSQTPWTSDIDANGFNLGFDDNTGIFANDTGNAILWFQTVASAINQLELFNAAAGGTILLRPAGGDTDIALDLASKGTDPVNFIVNGSTEWSINATALVPGADAANDIGTSTVGINDLHFGSGGVINFDGSDCTWTHGANAITQAGGCTFTTETLVSGAHTPSGDNTVDLGSTSATWQDLYTTTIELGADTDTTLARSAAGEVTLEGDAIIHAGRRTINVLAAGMKPNNTNPASCGDSFSSGASNVSLYVCTFADGATERRVDFIVPLPKSYNGGTFIIQFLWTAASGSGTFQLEVGCRFFRDDDALDQAMGTFQQTSDTLIATGDMHVSAESSAITCAGTYATGASAIFRVSRDTSVDTLNADALLIGMRVFYTDNASTDE